MFIAERDWPLEALVAAVIVALVLGLTRLARGAEPYEVEPGLWTCPAGSLIRAGRCIDDRNLPHGPVTEVSKLPSAGEGSLQPTVRYYAPAPTLYPSHGVNVYVIQEGRFGRFGHGCFSGTLSRSCR